MLEIKGDISLIDALQMLIPLRGTYVIHTKDGEIHVKDGAITWFSGGGQEECIRYIASYKGRVNVENSPTNEAFHLPIDVAVMRAAFLLPEENDQSENILTCPTDEYGWFAIVERDRVLSSRGTDKSSLQEALSLWKIAAEGMEEVSEIIFIGERGVFHIGREKGALIVGFCRSPKMMGILHRGIKRLRKHVLAKSQKEI